MKDKLYILQNNIAKYIKNYINTNNGFASRSFYGETFSLNLLYLNNMLDEKSKMILITNFENIDKTNPEYHWEFNNYALLNYLNISKDKTIKKYLNPLKFKNTSVTNWTLLRSITRLIANKDKDLAIKEAKEKIEKFQLKSGLILDKKDDKSFQYHCFSVAMIAEIYEESKDNYFKNSFLKGVEFIRVFILSNGESLYIGRGQNQSFGYGALIYILSLAYKYTNDKTILGDLDKVYKFLIQFQNEDGSFPLVMNGIEKGIPEIVNIKDANYAGWYPYNNYFDYLPFMGYFIAKAVKVLDKFDTIDIQYKKNTSYKDENFIKIVKPNYEAVISKPGGYWTNDMPIPFIVYKGKSITPMYGGEQFQKSLYNLEGIPLPFCLTFNKSSRWKVVSFFKENILWLISPFGIIKRKYNFFDNEIEIVTNIFSPFKFKNIYLELENRNILYGDLKFEGYEYSTSGKLKKYVNFNKQDRIVIRLEND